MDANEKVSCADAPSQGKCGGNRWYGLTSSILALMAAVGCTPNVEVRQNEASRTESADAGKPSRDGLLVELFSWWTAPGEAEAFQNLVDTHKVKYPEARLFNAAAASGVRAKETLKERLARNELPDLFQENAHDLKLYIHQNPGKLMPLDSMFDELGLRNVVFPEVVKDLMVDGHIYSMPVNLHRENSLIFNKKLFSLHGLKVPETLEELKAVCAAFKRKGVTAIATAHQGWILRIMFNSIAAGHMGARQYHDYFTGKLAPENTSLHESIRVFADLLFNYTNADAAEEGFGWMNAAQAVMDGDAAMYFHGDWAKGYLVQLGAAPDVDIGVAAAPGTRSMFLYNIDVFAMPRHAPNEAGAKAFLSSIASAAAQTGFNRIKGSSPIRSDLPMNDLDRCGRSTMQDLNSAEIRMLLRTGDGWDDAIGRFAKNRDEEALYQAYVANRPIQ